MNSQWEKWEPGLQTESAGPAPQPAQAEAPAGAGAQSAQDVTPPPQLPGAVLAPASVAPPPLTAPQRPSPPPAKATAVRRRSTALRGAGPNAARKTLWLAGVSDVVLIVIGIASTYTYTWHTGSAAHEAAHHIRLGLGVLAGAIAAVAVINFMCFYWIIQRLTDAIAAAVMLTYFILLACMLNKSVQTALNSTSLGGSMLTSLTTLTATVTGFYFVGTSYERASATKSSDGQ